MRTLYSEIPDNLEAVKSFLITDYSIYKSIIEDSEFVVFYDTCAIQHHSCLKRQYQEKICEYIKVKKGIVVITVCVLMELAGENHLLNENTITFFKILHKNEIKIILLEESNVCNFLREAFQSVGKINEIFRYALREYNRATTTIRETIKASSVFKTLVSDESVSENPNLCTNFFKSARSKKQRQDNLAEQLMGICIYMLLHLPAEPSCKYTLFTDDKAAAISLDKSIKSIPADVSNKKAGIYSSAKLFQNMFEEKFITTDRELKELIKTVYSENIYVLALNEKSDLQTAEYIFTAEELAIKIFKDGCFRILF